MEVHNNKVQKVQHLLLLVGSNPLPNAVAATLLARSESVITLFHSDDSFHVAQKLQDWLTKRGFLEPRLRQLVESRPSSIFAVVSEELKHVQLASVGLNYTGGTKAMSVHAYRAVEHWTNQQERIGRRVTPTFSYLNPRNLEMVFDPADPMTGERESTELIGLSVNFALQDLLDLHGWSLKHPPNLTPVLPTVAAALAKVCSELASSLWWRTWVADVLRATCRKEGREEWLPNSKMPDSLPLASSVSGASVDSFLKTLEVECSLRSGRLPLRQLAFNNNPKHFYEWLDGKWLEHHVLDQLKTMPDGLGLREHKQNVETIKVEFDVDVAVLRGYQLFVISCSTDTRKSLLKSKLFEAFVRARQLGGDEARVALVSCSERPTEIEQEMRRDVDPEGRIRVFGQPHLGDLANQLREWIETQSKGV